MESSILRIEHLSHSYGSGWAIEDINMEISKAGILGLLGSNGAGKSTTMNIMCGVVNQTMGDVWINGVNLRKNPSQSKSMIGFLPQTAPLHLELTVDEYLIYCASLRDLKKSQIPHAVSEAKQKCGLTKFSNRILRNLSGGYKQRVGIAQAIVHKPKLVVLDEATNGLDPNQILEVRKLIREIAEERSVIFSSHILTEVQATCNDIIMIDHGRIVFSGTMNAFNNYIFPDTLVVKMLNPPGNDTLRTIQGILDVVLLDKNTFRMKFDHSLDILEKIIRLSVEKDWRLIEICLEKISLEEIFAKLSGGRNN